MLQTGSCFEIEYITVYISDLSSQVLEGGSDSARVDRMKMAEALEICLKSVADRRSEMMMDDVGHGDIEAWISE